MNMNMKKRNNLNAPQEGKHTPHSAHPPSLR